jgi:glycosyltransferase involved in cell wall biosynthesis
MSVARPAATAPGAGRSLVFVTSQFPEPNETFIVREIAELARMGFAITVLSLRPPPAVINPPEARALLPLVVYPPASHAKVLLEALRAFGRGPRAALRLVARALVDVVAALRTPLLAAKQAAVVPLVLAYAGRLPPARARLHAHFASVPTAAVRMLAAFRGQGYSFTAHAWDIYVGENRRQVPARIEGADLVVTCTAYNAQVLAAMAPAGHAAKVQLCHHGLDFAAYEPGAARTPGLIVGGAALVEKKGLGDLIAACATLRARDVAFQCVLLGEGPERPRLEAHIRSLGLADRVRLAGRVPHPELVRWLREAAVVAHPSVVDRRGSMDGIPNTILEAMAVEAPVVATRLSGIPEVIVPGETGLLVEPGDVDGLADALARLLADPVLARRLGVAARRLVLERFDIERNVARLAGFLRAE